VPDVPLPLLLLQVRDFDVQDAVPYGVTLHYENKDGDPKTDVLFAQHRWAAYLLLVLLAAWEQWT
jgi:hypothetical protein